MGRYRPPVTRSAPYITPEGARALRKELHKLWKVERPVVTAAVHEAAKNGDRSENGDYIYGKKRLREIDRRVRYLSKRLDEITVTGFTSAPGSLSKMHRKISIVSDSWVPMKLIPHNIKSALIHHWDDNSWASASMMRYLWSSRAPRPSG